MPPAVTIRAAGTVGNFGPGFDVMSLALAGIGDTVTLARADDGAGDTIEIRGPGAGDVPTGWADNVAGVAIDALRAQTGDATRYHLVLAKPRPGCSGLGSSASSAAGAALCYSRLHPSDDGATFSSNDLIAAASAGELAAGGGNPDDVAAVILGGIAMVTPTPEGYRYSRLQPPADLHVAVVAPDLRLATADMRRLLPESWPRDDVIWNAARLANLVDACHRNDVTALGAALDDRLHLPYRKVRMPYFDAARQAALDAGAFGASLSGSGPAMIAVTDEPGIAARAAAAMAKAVRASGLEAEHFVARPELGVPHAL